jgi:CRISP-associated protein Cas1
MIPLVLDLMEEFRPIIVDTLTLSLFNLNILKPDDFYMEKPEESAEFNVVQLPAPDVEKDPIGLISGKPADADSFNIPEQRMDSGEISLCGVGKYPVKLKDDAFRRVIEAFEKKLTTEFFYPHVIGLFCELKT